MSNPVLSVALALTGKYGLSVVPVGGNDWTITEHDDKTGEDVVVSLRKKPAYMNGQGPKKYGWNHLQKKIMTETEVRRIFAKSPALGLVMGEVSGFAECIDFDAPGAYEAWRDLLIQNGHEDLVSRLVIQETQTPGHHQAIYRCPDGIEGNRKLAERPATDEELSTKPHQRMYGVIETRGEGGYALIAPSEGYRVVQGSVHALPTITGEERTMLLRAAQYFDLTPEEVPIERRSKDAPRDSQGKTPGDDFDVRGEWSDILCPHGWQETGHRGRLTEWTRPGKGIRDGGSATSGLGHHGIDMIRIFTTSGWPLDNKLYGKFRAYAALNYGGDLSAAAKDLYAKGYGDRSKPGNADDRRAEAPASVASDEERTEPQSSRWNLLTIEDMLSMPDKPMLVKDLLGVQDRWMIFGPPGGGKTLAALSFLVCCAVGGTWLGRFECERPLRVLYATSEGTFGLGRRLSACLAYNLLDPADVLPNMRFLTDLPQVFDADGERGIWGFADHLEQEGFLPDVLLLDTMSKANLGSKEIDNGEAAVICDTLARFGARMGCAPGFVHHTGWGQDHPRGASAFLGDMDLVLRAMPDKDDPKEAKSAKAPLEGKLHRYKGKDIKPFDDIDYRLLPYMGTAIFESDPNGHESGATALGTALHVMRMRTTQEWWNIGEIVQAAGGRIAYDAFRVALQRDVNADVPSVERDDSMGHARYRTVRK